MLTRRALLTGSAALAALAVAPALAAPPAARVGDLPAPAGAGWLAPGAWGAYLAALPLRPVGTPVRAYDGREMAMDALRVVDLPLVPGDLQQCADSILRLRASFERDRGGDPTFRYTSGWVSRWSAWQKGERPVVSGSKVSVRKVNPATASDGSFEAWLRDLFMYAGTYSLKADTVPPPGAIAAGDVLVAPGSPGHAVLILGVARGDAHTYALVGQGFMPAMDFHVLKGPADGWFVVEGLTLPSTPIPMPWSTRRVFVEG